MGMLKCISVHALLRVRLFLKDRMTLFVLTVSVLGFLFCMADMNRG